MSEILDGLETGHCPHVRKPDKFGFRTLLTKRSYLIELGSFIDNVSCRFRKLGDVLVSGCGFNSIKLQQLVSAWINSECPKYGLFRNPNGCLSGFHTLIRQPQKNCASLDRFIKKLYKARKSVWSLYDSYTGQGWRVWNPNFCSSVDTHCTVNVREPDVRFGKPN